MTTHPITRALSFFALSFALAACPAIETGRISDDSTDNEQLVVSGGTILTMADDQAVINDGALAIQGNRIVAIGTVEEIAADFPDATLIDARGKIVLPGLVNTHTHVPMTLFRGIADDLPLTEWLNDVIFPAEAQFVDEDFVRWGTRLACLEMIRSGITTFADSYYFEDAIAEETDICGMRAVLGETLIDFPVPDNKTWEEAISYMRRFVERWQGHERITPAVAPHAPYTVSGEHLQEGHALATELDVPLLIHLAEDQSEVDTIMKREAMRPVEYADHLGILDERVLAAHMIYPDAGEIEILAARGVGVAHCPESNMKIAAGVAPVPQLLAAGVAVGLGTDGSASNNNLSLWDEIDSAAKLHKVISGDPTVLDARTALMMATLGGARAIHMAEEIGSLEVGKRADLIIVGVDGPHQQPVYDPYSVLVYATQAADVEAVVIDGHVVMQDGDVLTVDAGTVLAEARRYRDRISAEIVGGHPPARGQDP
jgi:5-methylthioadenosine/S-adenosylhomocysteine deaminase